MCIEREASVYICQWNPHISSEYTERRSSEQVRQQHIRMCIRCRQHQIRSCIHVFIARFTYIIKNILTQIDVNEILL